MNRARPSDRMRSHQESRMSALAEVNDASFEQQVLKNATPTIVDFWAEW